MEVREREGSQGGDRRQAGGERPGCEQRRGRRGCFEAEVRDFELLDRVAEVARAAAPEDPASVSTRAWDDARSLLDRGDELPTARAITMRRNKGRVGQTSWQQVLKLALMDESERPRKDTTARDPEAPHLDVAHLYYGLRRVALELGLETYITRALYVKTRRDLIAADKGNRARLADLLPGEGQIMRIVLAVKHGRTRVSRQLTESGWWTEALKIAGLRHERPKYSGGQPPRATLPALPIEAAIDEFLNANGCWPSTGALERFARMANAVIEHRDRTRTWQAQLDEVAATRTEAGLWSPPCHARHGRRPIWFPEGGIPGAPKRDEPRHEKLITREQLIEDLREFDRLVRKTPGMRAIAQTYSAISAEKGWASSRTIVINGGWTNLLSEAQRLNAEEDRHG